MFTIKIKNLKAATILGVFDWEKEAKRPVILNIAIELADDNAGRSDAMQDTVDYAEIEQRIVTRLDHASYNLIERMVNDIGHFILSLDARIAQVSVEADKPGALKYADSVAVAQLFRR